MKKKIVNPFICQGYESPEYFCDRIEETESMTSMLYKQDLFGTLFTISNPKIRMQFASISTYFPQKIKAILCDC